MNEPPDKQDREELKKLASMTDTPQLSKCCHAPVTVEHGCDSETGHGGKPCTCIGGTHWYECSLCHNPCDPDYHFVDTDKKIEQDTQDTEKLFFRIFDLDDFPYFDKRYIEYKRFKEKVMNILSEEIAHREKQVRQETAEKICVLIDEIESRSETNTIEEWKQYKGIRNAIRDKYVLKKGKI